MEKDIEMKQKGFYSKKYGVNWGSSQNVFPLSQSSVFSEFFIISNEIVARTDVNTCDSILH